jgi:hypothetical protein
MHKRTSPRSLRLSVSFIFAREAAETQWKTDPIKKQQTPVCCFRESIRPDFTPAIAMGVI